MRQLALIISTLVFFCPTVVYACSCVLTGLGPAKPPRPLRERPIIFVGIALDSPVLRDSRLPRRATFVTETSWRGALPDTVVVTFDDAPCIAWLASSRYLVFAEPDPQRPGLLRVGACDFSYPAMDTWALSLQDSLGPPTWHAPPVGARAIDRIAIPFDSLVPERDEFGGIPIGPPFPEPPVRLEIAGRSGVQRESGGPLWFLAPGLYQFRLTWQDGVTYTSYVRLQCESQDPNSTRCSGHRSFLGLRAAP